MTGARRSLLLVALSLSSAASAAAPPPDFEALLRRGHETYEAAGDYVCLFHRKERIGKRLVEQRNIRAKFQKPFRVLMSWTEGKMKGAESLYDPPLYGDRIKAHAGGLISLVTLTLNPAGSLAMKDNRHTVREFGIGHLLDMIDADAKKSRETGEGSVTYREETLLADGPAWVFEGLFPDGKGFYSPRVVVCFDQRTSLPVKMDIYDAAGLLEEYVFEDLRLNVGLTAADFKLRRR